MIRPSSRVLILIAGVIWGLWYVGMSQIGWGKPGSMGYARYETYNRLLPIVLLLVLAATHLAPRRIAVTSRLSVFGVWTASLGLLMMIAGNVMEFWLFTLAPYAPGSVRGLGWGTYSIGMLVFYLGGALFGSVLLSSHSSGRYSPAPIRASGLLFLLWLPTGAALLFLGPLFGTEQLAPVIACALCGAAYILLGLSSRLSRNDGYLT